MKKKNPLYQSNFITFPVTRNGSWGLNARSVRVSFREGLGSSRLNNGLGFRLCRTTKGNQ